ncbi:fermentation/respiration switch protein [Striga asiatica]|uniref:Fermentation/respiration switch protein n=1 Tax=Striga asiatica TaxID=4170 RepID=A0A5A7NYD1_STRAF|nr:fermentation/respiration switch protein [Striga asiatica]
MSAQRDAQETVGTNKANSSITKMWKRTWTLPVKGRIKSSLLRCRHEFMRTKTQLQKRGIGIIAAEGDSESFRKGFSLEWVADLLEATLQAVKWGLEEART